MPANYAQRVQILHNKKLGELLRLGAISDEFSNELGYFPKMSTYVKAILSFCFNSG